MEGIVLRFCSCHKKEIRKEGRTGLENWRQENFTRESFFTLPTIHGNKDKCSGRSGRLSLFRGSDWKCIAISHCQVDNYS